MKSYGGSFHCICCRCSIRWLLLMWAIEKTPLYYSSRCGQLCYSNDRFPALGESNITNARNGSAARLSRRALYAFVCFQYHLRVFCPSSLLLCLSWACMVSSSSSQGPPVKCKECKWLMRVRAVFMAKREQMLSEMLRWFPSQIKLPILPALLLLTQPWRHHTARVWQSSSGCLCLLGHNYNNTLWLIAKVERPLFTLILVIFIIYIYRVCTVNDLF